MFTLMGGISMLVALLLLAIAGHQVLQEQGYQSGQCTIIAKQLQHEVSTTSNTTYSNNGNNSTAYTTTTTSDVYAPYFRYTVHTADGRSYPASGYDGSDSYTSDLVGQQAIVDHYNIGQRYQCWYNPANPTQAILVRQPDWVLILIGGGFLLLGGLFATIGIVMLLGLFGSARRAERYAERG